jgi:hypothetical protein
LLLAVAAFAAPAQAGGGACTVFFDQPGFEEFCLSHGKIIKGIEDFEPPIGNVPFGQLATLAPTLQGNVPNVDPASGLGFPNGLLNQNLVIQANLLGVQAPDIVVGTNLIGMGPGFLDGANIPNSIVVGPNLFGESLDLIFAPDESHTGIGFDVLDPITAPLQGTVHISVFDMNNLMIAKEVVPAQEGKFFFGIWCPEPIGRINIAGVGPAGEEGGELVDNIQMWMEPGQPPACPGDCAFPPDKMVNIVDFLALLAQWGGPGGCDLDGNGIVNIQDFLLLLAFWGPCPTPINDECFSPEPIDKTDPEGLTIVNFDMWSSTPSPEPYQCLTEPPVHKDIWYCLTNVTAVTTGATITTNIPLFIEVYRTCQCPPGPVIACGDDAGTNQFVLEPGEQALIRLINVFDLPNDQLKGSMFIQNKLITTVDVNFFENPGLFEEAVFEAGKFTKAIWDFKPDHLPPGVGLGIGDFLDIFSHPNNAPGVWWDGEVDLWPPEVDNVQFVSNVNPADPMWAPHGGPDGLAYWKAGGLPGLDNNALTANYFVDSFDIISGPPAGDNHTAIAFELLQLPGFGHEDPIFLISVYDKNNQEIGSYTMTAVPGQKLFLGILTKDPTITIQRVDIWDTMGGSEGISFIALYQQLGGVVPCDEPFTCGGPPPVECPPVGSGCFCFKRTDGTGACMVDSACDLPQCPNGDADCPPGFLCAVDTCCGFPICLPVCGTAPEGPPPAPGTLTATGIVPDTGQ